MGISFEPLTPAHMEAVKAFNRRMSAAPPGLWINESPDDHPLAHDDGSAVYREPFLALDNGVVHGGYILKHQPFFLRGRQADICTFQLPISEGFVDKRYSMVGIQLALDSVRRQPLQFSLGMGGMDLPLPLLLRALNWHLVKCPFYFLVNRPFAFLRGMAHLRKRTFLRLGMDMLAFTGIGWAGLKLAQWLKSFGARRVSAEYALVEKFGQWTDEIWDAAKDQYALVAVRDQTILKRLYPPADKRFLRLKIEHDGRAIGWAVLLDTQMTGHKQFGNLRVGTIVDCLSIPQMESAVIQVATELLTRKGVDLIVSNQLHKSWGAALKSSGFWRGPSNFVFAASPELAHQLDPIESQVSNIHMNRGDADGPAHLM